MGEPYWPTPAGQFYIRDKLTDFNDPFYGPVAFGTSARSNVLTEWPGGGFIGVHGTNEPGILPGRVSHGCVRMLNSAILRLAHLMSVGTPVTVTRWSCEGRAPPVRSRTRAGVSPFVPRRRSRSAEIQCSSGEPAGQRHGPQAMPVVVTFDADRWDAAFGVEAATARRPPRVPRGGAGDRLDEGGAIGRGR